MAVGLWGEPRTTLDLDFTIWVEPDQWAQTIADLTAQYETQLPEAIRFVMERRVLPITTRQGIRVDLAFAVLPYEHEMIRRAVVRELEGHRIRLASVEDLLLMKLVADRE